MSVVNITASEGTTRHVRIAAGRTVDIAYSTADLADAVFTLQLFRSGPLGPSEAIAAFTGDGGANSGTVRVVNISQGDWYFNATAIEVDAGTFAGTVDIVATYEPVVLSVFRDPVTGAIIYTITDEGIEFELPVTLPADSVLGLSDIGSELSAGVGITGAADAYATSVVREGGMIRTRIFIDIEGLNGGGAANDIIGADGAGAAYIGRVTAAVNGDIVAGFVECAEVPTGSDPDVDLWSANEATGVEDTLITALTGEVQLTNGGDHTLARRIALIALPVAGQYLYLTGGDTTAGAYTAGQFIIELIGIPE